MHKRFIFYGMLLCLGLSVFATAHAKTFALVMGIDDYTNMPLDGAVNDAQDIYNALIKHAADVNDVTFLTNKKATKPAIQAAWDKMVRDSARGDTLLVTYAGHGSQVPDQDGDEEDGLDEVFLLSEYREASVDAEQQMIRDDEWYRWFKAAKGRQVVFVADACH